MRESNPKPKDQYSEAETQERMDKALRAALNTPPKPQKLMKKGKPARKPAKASS